MTARRPTVAVYVSGHGFGHAVRSAEVARALLARGARVVVRTEAPRWLFPEDVEYLAAPEWPVDIGVAQHGGLEMDIDETRRRWTHFAATFDARVDRETALLHALQADLVLGDIPPLAFAAAARASLPSAATTNFAWDWIYEGWPGFESIVDTIRQAYRHATVLYRLPLHAPDGFPSFGRVQDVPLVARRARHPRAQVRQSLGLPTHARVVLLSFGGFDARGFDVAALAAAPEYTFLMTLPMAALPGPSVPNVRRITEQPADYASLLAACDTVVTKPGYGIVADCLANRVPVLFTDRGPFREYDVLVEALRTLGHARHIPRADLLAGHLAPHLAALAEQPDAWADVRVDGASVIAERALELTYTASVAP